MRIRIDVMGLKEDIALLWERFAEDGGYGIELETKGEPLVPVIGEYSEGSIEDMPEEDGFDSIFEDFPRLAMFIEVINETDWGLAYWR